MKDIRIKKFEKQWKKLDLDLPMICFFVWDMIEASDRSNRVEIIYNKQFFADYYCVDIDTFHKWIRAFCPKLWNEAYKKKRMFSQDEVSYIYERLGKETFKNIRPRNRKQLMDYIFKDRNWKKSRRYQELAFELEDYFPSGIQINNLPPKLVFEILTEEIEDFRDESDEERIAYYERQNYKLSKIFLKYQIMTEHEKNVRLRWLRKWLSKVEDDGSYQN